MKRETASIALDIVLRTFDDEGPDDYADGIALMEELSSEAERTDDEDVTRILEYLRRKVAEKQEHDRLLAEREANPRSAEQLLDDYINHKSMPMSNAEMETWHGIPIETRQKAKFEGNVRDRMEEIRSGSVATWTRLPGGFRQIGELPDTGDMGWIAADREARRRLSEGS